MRKNEKSFEKKIVWHLRALGWSVDVIDSKAQYSKALRMYKRSSAARVGFPDLVCVMPGGRAAYIELKAPNKKNTVRLEQLSFLKEKMACGAFVCVTWAIEHFDGILKEFHQTKGQSLEGHLSSLRVVSEAKQLKETNIH